jgi:hypothetical protein
MTREDIIRLAREAGCAVYDGEDIAPALVRFAALVEWYLITQGYRRCAKGQRMTQYCGLLEEAVEAQREACIKIIEAYQIPVGNSAAGEMARDWTYDALKEIRDEIRERGESK